MTPLSSAAEQALWAWETGARRVPLASAAPPEVLCTACRARRADEAVTALRTLPDGLTDVERTVEAVRVGLDAPVLMTAIGPTEWMRGFARYLDRVGYPQRTLVTGSVVRRKGNVNATITTTATIDCWLVPLDRSNRPLFLAVDRDGHTAGWMNVAPFHARCKNGSWIEPHQSMVYPFVADQRAARAVKYTGSSYSRGGEHMSLVFAPPDPVALNDVAEPGGNVRVAIVAGLLGMP